MRNSIQALSWFKRKSSSEDNKGRDDDVSMNVNHIRRQNDEMSDR